MTTDDAVAFRQAATDHTFLSVRLMLDKLLYAMHGLVSYRYDKAVPARYIMALLLTLQLLKDSILRAFIARVGRPRGATMPSTLDASLCIATALLDKTATNSSLEHLKIDRLVLPHWTRYTHRWQSPAFKKIVETVLLVAMRREGTDDRLPIEMWLLMLSFLPGDPVLRVQ